MATAEHGEAIMPAASLKPLLLASKREPVSCAIGLTKDKHGVVLLEKKMKPRQVLAAARKAAAEKGIELDAASLRFGKAEVDTDADAGLVKFHVNKAPASALHAKLQQQLKKAGFGRCEIVVDAALEAEDHDGPHAHAEGAPGGHGGNGHAGARPQQAAHAGGGGHMHSLVADPSHAMQDLHHLDELIARGALTKEHPEFVKLVDQVRGKLKTRQHAGRAMVADLAREAADKNKAWVKNGDVIKGVQSMLASCNEYLSAMNAPLHGDKPHLTEAYKAYRHFETAWAAANDLARLEEDFRADVFGIYAEGSKKVRDTALTGCGVVAGMISAPVAAGVALTAAVVKAASNHAAGEKQNIYEVLGEGVIEALFSAVGPAVEKPLAGMIGRMLANKPAMLLKAAMKSPLHGELEQALKALPAGLNAAQKLKELEKFVMSPRLLVKISHGLAEQAMKLGKGVYKAELHVFTHLDDFKPPHLQHKLEEFKAEFLKGHWLKEHVLEHLMEHGFDKAVHGLKHAEHAQHAH